MGLAFTPNATTLTLAVTTSSVGAASNLPQYSSQIRVHNVGPNLAFFRLGAGTLTAAITDTPVAVGTTEVFTKGGATSIAAICGAGTATFYVTPGESG